MSENQNSNLQSELWAIREGAAFAAVTDRAFLRITGSDATRWLNGMVTNSIQSLQAGEGNYNFLLNAQGRIQGDCTIYREPGDGDASFLLEIGDWQLETVSQLLDKFIIMDDVELSGATALRFGIAVSGPQSQAVLSKTLLTAEEGLLVPGKIDFITRDGSMPVIVIRCPIPAATAYELWTDSSQVQSTLLGWLRSAGATVISPQALEAFRILSGTPRYGIDIRERDLPQETNQTHALHFAKGCYLGQEIVERIRSRGQVHRLFTAFTLQGDLPANLPTPLEAAGKPAGEITSAMLVPLPEGEAILALGYARREALDTKQTLTYTGGTAVPRSLMG